MVMNLARGRLPMPIPCDRRPRARARRGKPYWLSVVPFVSDPNHGAGRRAPNVAQRSTTTASPMRADRGRGRRPPRGSHSLVLPHRLRNAYRGHDPTYGAADYPSSGSPVLHGPTPEHTLGSDEGWACSR